VGIFLHDAAVIRLVRAILTDMHGEWGNQANTTTRPTAPCDAVAVAQMIIETV
jgi:hypothetical protein